MLSLNKTVRDVALELPQATRVFEKLKIDYCCGGDQPLGEACVTAGVAIDNLERLLEEAGQTQIEGSSPRDFQKATLSELINHILDKHHVFTKEEMVRLEALLAKVIAAHGENHSELPAIGVLFHHLCADLKPHMFKEEQILFPYILKMESRVSDQESRPLLRSAPSTIRFA